MVCTKQKRKIRWQVILPPWLVIAVMVVLNLWKYDLFVQTVTAVVDWILNSFAWMFNGITLAATAIVVICYVTPIKNIRFGGAKARPMISYKSYVWIVLCTIMGAGLMLWACAEPVIHLHKPSASVVAGAMSTEAVHWAMENIMLEWTFSLMAIYALAAILFAFVFYNMKKKFSVGSMLIPLVGDKRAEKYGSWIDMLCVFSIATGLAATLGSGILLLVEGVVQATGGRVANSKTAWIICAVLLIVTFTLSASSGLKKGITFFSNLNAWFYFALGMFILIFGPTAYILNLGSESFGGYLTHFFKLSLQTSAADGDGWSRWWTQFYWLIAFAWTPMSAVFLGRISRGYTVKDTLNIIFIIPSLFSVLWMSLFSGSSIYYELTGHGLYDAITNGNTASAAYTLLKCLPLAGVIIPVFIFTGFISYVTSADSNTNAMAALCTEGIEEDNQEASVGMKVFWGVSIGALCIIMLSAYGIDGMKMLADIGGFPSAFLMIAFAAAWIRIMKNPQKYDVHKEDYDAQGKPYKTERLPVKEDE